MAITQMDYTGNGGNNIDLYEPDFVEESTSGMTTSSAKHFTTTKKPKYITCVTYYSGTFYRVFDVENERAWWWGFAGNTTYNETIPYSAVANVTDTGFDLYGVSSATTKDFIFAYY